MKKSIVLSVFCLTLCITVTGCKKTENQKLVKDSQKEVLQIYDMNDKLFDAENHALATLTDVYTSDYTVEDWVVTDVKEPAGIVCKDNEVIISDRKNDCLIKADYAGNVLKKIGQTGSGKSEFLSPGAIAEYDNEVYVIDQGNNRVQVFDTDLSYVREVKLKDKRKSDPSFKPEQISVNHEGLYVTSLELSGKGSVDKYTDGQSKEVGKNFIGTSAGYDNNIYLINSMVRYYDKKEDTFGADSSGPEWLMKIKNDTIEKVCELPQGLYITDFTLDDKGIVCLSGSGEGVYRLNWQGDYVETFAYIKGLNDELVPQLSVTKEQEYYIAMSEAGKIVKCYKSN
ncbi:6-bladed beta-propeller [Vagococcus acidifermentans]|uniref:6-bladed beta-propeller n=1 Tax=Vagococcus acidifermentans TaxID=564710 RepID=A0A430ALJ0_9ENTE|nr:6-bladed beta-propeller [Vagococcus acidifermentans]RSU08946.1 hypothetical protein CBF27_13830 [Vagococcus acidifermentans]